MKPKAKVRPSVEQITLEFLREEREWPNFTVLPLKKRSQDGFPILGLVFFHDVLTVYEANLYDKAEDVMKAPTHTYPTVEALVIDGWMVD
jgi:hypothetical protein